MDLLLCRNPKRRQKFVAEYATLINHCFHPYKPCVVESLQGKYFNRRITFSQCLSINVNKFQNSEAKLSGLMKPGSQIAEFLTNTIVTAGIQKIYIIS